MRGYSLLKLFTGFVNAAFTLWKLTVSKAIRIVRPPASRKTHQ